jgi:hypothetical protein
MGLTIGSLLNLTTGGATATDGDSFASKYGSLFQTDNQRLLAEYSQGDQALQSNTARVNLERIAAENTAATDTGIDTSTGEPNRFAAGRNLVARSVDQTSPTEANVSFRTLAGGPAGSLKA